MDNIINKTGNALEQILQLRAKVLQAERERIAGAETLSISQVRKRLRERVNDIYG